MLDALVDELIKRPPKSTTRDYVESIGAAVLIALALRAFVIEAFKIPSSSMYPTLEIGDHIFVNKFIYGVRIPWTTTKLFELRGPKRGEVIVFIYPCDPDRDYIKRVVALAGDTVEVRCNVVYVNGKADPEQAGRGRGLPLRGLRRERPATGTRRRAAATSETVTATTTTRSTTPSGRAAISASQDGTLDDRRRPRLPDASTSRTSRRAARPAPRTPPNGDATSTQVKGKIVETKPEAAAGACEPQLHYVVPAGPRVRDGRQPQQLERLARLGRGADREHQGQGAVHLAVVRALGPAPTGPASAGRGSATSST